MGNSKLLDYLLEVAKKKYGGGRGTLTTAGLVLAAIEECCVGQAACLDSYGEEVSKTAAVLENQPLTTAEMLEKLRAFVASPSAGDINDRLAIQTRIFNAREEAEQKKAEALTADALIDYIFRNPPEAFSEALNLGKGGQKTAASAEQNPVKTAEAKPKTEEAKPAEKPQETSSPAQDTGDLSSSKAAPLMKLTRDAINLRKKLSQLVFGQDHAIQTVSSGYFVGEVSAQTDKEKKRPRAVFLFAGPPGVGKTFMAEKTAEILGLPFRRFDMSDYTNPDSMTELTGDDTKYKGSGSGQLTGFVDRNPHCVLLFDEIEKACRPVIQLFLQILDGGRLRDNYTDNEVSFLNAIMIFTTNAGRPMYKDSETTDFSDVSPKLIMKAIEEDKDQRGMPYFPVELCSRFAAGNVVMFNHMDACYLRKIAKKEILRQARNMEEAYGVSLDIDELVYTALLFSEGGSADARGITLRSEKFMLGELQELLRLVNSTNAEADKTLKTIRLTVRLPQEGEIRQLFMPTEKPTVLVVADPALVARCAEVSGTSTIVGAQTEKEVKQIVQETPINMALIDLSCGRRDPDTECLNIEDMDSEARDALDYIREFYRTVPVYILDTPAHPISEEEQFSLQQTGILGTLNPESEDFSKTLTELGEQLHQNNSMRELAKRNRIVNFQTGQTTSEDGSVAEIYLFDFSLATAVDPGDSENVMSSVSKPNITFDQIIGADDAKKELQFFISYLKDPGKFRKFGLHMPRGVILYGPPGTGKTSLAKAMATEADVTFIAAQGNEFLQKYVGEGPQKVHDYFKMARKYAPSILFVDEIDVIAADRTKGESSPGRADVLTAFLAEMDGFATDPSKPVFVLAATNLNCEPGSSDSLDAAFMRRFDRRILVDEPKKKDRVRYLTMKTEENDCFAISESMIDNIAMRSEGMSLARLESVIDMSIRMAIREGSEVVTDEMLEEAFETMNDGEEKQWEPDELERTARHEAGHAFVAWKNGERPTYLTIVARGSHGGYMQHENREDKGAYTKAELRDRIRVSLAGRAAEMVYYEGEDGLSTGASGDLQSATSMAEQIFCTYGMDDRFGLAVITRESLRNTELAKQVRDAVNELLDEELQKAIQIIRDDKDTFEKLVAALLEKNHLTGDELKELLT